MKRPLTLQLLQREAARFAGLQAQQVAPVRLVDGKSIGTWLERRFKEHLQREFDFKSGSSARGIDFPELKVDLKMTSSRLPQSSCRFQNARQKIYGLGYSLLIFVYDKHVDDESHTVRLVISQVIFVPKERTADFNATSGLRALRRENASEERIRAYFAELELPIWDEIERSDLVREVMLKPPDVGSLTISNAPQWRLNYGRVAKDSNGVPGVLRLL